MFSFTYVTDMTDFLVLLMLLFVVNVDAEDETGIAGEDGFQVKNHRKLSKKGLVTLYSLWILGAPGCRKWRILKQNHTKHSALKPKP